MNTGERIFWALFNGAFAAMFVVSAYRVAAFLKLTDMQCTKILIFVLALAILNLQAFKKEEWR